MHVLVDFSLINSSTKFAFLRYICLHALMEQGPFPSDNSAFIDWLKTEA